MLKNLTKVGILFLAFLLVASKSTHAQDFKNDYYVTGVNVCTGERVVGWLENFESSPYVNGYVLERTGRTRVTGHFSGRGQFRLESLTSVYDCEVTDEVMETRQENRLRRQQ